MAVSEIDPRKTRADNVRSILGKVVANHIDGQGDDIAGFAIVTWDGRGEGLTGYLTNTGPIGRNMMPSYVHDVLNNHVAASIAQESTAEIIPPDDLG